MESNGNQRKRAGRVPKITNTGEKTAPQNSESNQVVDVSAVAVSPTLEEFGTAPPAECRRSSRKKIIKFDVRDLLNKNRKTHKIQIEARIDSNAPTTSKAANTSGTETANSKNSLTTSREDLLSKHKTFLEKSAIFRRYSVSQEHKAPPPPLPIPPLLGKANEKDSGFSGTSSCQEFLSHAMIKPKQPTSLIVAQIESNKPSSVTPSKRRNVHNSLEMGSKTTTSSEKSSVVQQKKRGRPAKNKSQAYVETNAISVQEESSKKKMTPEKAKNWKEYKACLAQQSSSTNEGKINKIKNKEILISEHQINKSATLLQKQTELKIFDDTLQSDVSRSDDDGNFSGFQTGKDDVSCDSPVLEKLFSEQSVSVKQVLIQPKSVVNINNEAIIEIFKDVENKSSTESSEDQTYKTKQIDTNVIAKIASEKNLNQEGLYGQDFKLRILMPEKMEAENIFMMETEDTINESVGRTESNSNEHFQKHKFMKKNRNSPNFTQKKDIQTELDINISRRQPSPIEERNAKRNSPATADKVPDVQKSYTASQETEISNDNNPKETTEYKSSDLRQQSIKNTYTNSKKVYNKNEEIQAEVQKTILETGKPCQNCEPEKAYTTTTCVETVHELNNPVILPISDQIVEAYTTQASTSSDEIKSFSRTSSSSESENAFERSSYSSTTSSSSPRSYKSGDKLKVSIKRIPLPNSPSTSSQTSTSEEFNSTNIKRKPSMIKRSRRLQKICKEGIDNKDDAKNIDDCFKRIPNVENKLQLNIHDYFLHHDKKIEQNIDQEICIDTLKTEIRATSSKVNIKEVVTPELIKNVNFESKTKYTSKESFTDLPDTLPNEFENLEYLSGKEKVKIKSLRSCKDYNSYTKDEDVDKPKSKEKKIILEEIERSQQKPLAYDTKEDKQKTQNLENSLKQKTITEKNIESGTSLSVGEIEENEQSKRSIKFQSSIQLGHKKPEKSSSIAKELTTVSEKTNIDTEIGCIEKDKVDKLKTQNKKNSDTSEFKAEKTIKNALVSSLTNEENKSTKHLKCQSAIQADLEHKGDQNFVTIFKETEIENIDETTTPASVSNDPEDVNKMTPTNSKNLKEMIFVKESKNDAEMSAEEHKVQTYFKNKAVEEKRSETELMKVESTIKPGDLRKSPNQKLSRLDTETLNKIASAGNKTILRKICDDLVNESIFREHSTQEDIITSKTIQVHISECNKNKTSDEKPIQTNREQTPDNQENDCKIIATKLTKVTPTEGDILKENDSKLKVILANYKTDIIFPEIEDVANLDRTKDKTINCRQDSTLIAETLGDDKLDKVITPSTRCRSDREDISTIESTYSITQKKFRTNDEFKKVDTSVSDVSKTLKDELSSSENPLNAAEISSPKSQLNTDEYSFEIGKTSEDNYDSQLLKENLEDKNAGDTRLKLKETEIAVKDVAVNKKESADHIPSTKEEIPTIIRKRYTSKKGTNSPNLFSGSMENQEKSPTELNSSGSSKKTSLSSLPTEQTPATTDNIKPISSKEISTKLFLPTITTKTVLFKHVDSSKLSHETNLSDKSKETQKSCDTVVLIKETCVANTQQENPIEDKNEISLAEAIPAKRRFRKPRFKNLYVAEVDSETDSSNGKSTPINVITHQNLNTQTMIEIVKAKEIKSLNTLSKSEEKVCEIEKNHEDVIVKDAITENSQTNLLSSQIKNVSIETNTLLDILRTVQSNTEAALKATKSPINIDSTDSEQTVESTIKMQFHVSSQNPQDLLEIQPETEITSPAVFDNESSLAVKKYNLSPSRSDSGSPLSLKKVTPSPTRSNSSSPLTLKKATRRYERRSRRVEDSAHKTLEETFAEIAAQSSKAVLAAKEFDINEDQIKNETSQKQLDVVLNIEKEQNIKEVFGQLENTTAQGEVPSNIEEKLNEPVLNVSQELHKTPLVASDVEINSTESIAESETLKLTPAKRGRKPKNRQLEFPMTETKEMEEINTTPKLKEDTTLTKEVTKVNEFQSETEIIANEKVDENITKKLKKVNESPESTQISDFSEDKSNNSLSLLPEQQADSLEYANLIQTHIEESLKQLEDVNESKVSKKNKKSDTKTVLDEDKTCHDKEVEVLTPKQPINKRDSSSCKSEITSVSKKISKKPKNEENDSLNLQKIETLTKSTTTPPSKRGRKPKNQQPQSPQAGSKKKNKKDVEDVGVEERLLDSENESLNNSTEKCLDEKLAKKKRQRKLKEAFEAALTDDKEKSKEAFQSDISSPKGDSSFGLTFFKNDDDKESIKFTCMTPVETEDDMDPLKDIEKFIADGVNLLKRDYKVDEDSVDDVMQTTPSGTTKIIEESIKIINEEAKHIFNTFETPADTPIHTPSVTPPPKSPTSVESSTPDEHSGVRRSHRIKLITKTPKALVGRGLVRDRERFSIKDDVETKSHYTMDDHLTDLAEVEAKNAKFLKEMEERLSNFHVIKENDYLCERVISREARKMICDCFLTHGEEERGELGCGEDCLNRLLMIECGSECNVKERCTNKRFQKLLCSPCRVFRTEKKGFGIMADIEILPGEFIMEYVGEVIDTEEFEKRRIIYSQDKNRHYYFMALRSDAIIDATIKGNISRFINHSCDPNAETQKWTVNGELRIGFFSRKSIMPGEEITFNYQYQRYGREAQRCYCESANCRGWIGQEPTSDEGEQMDDEEDESEDEEDTSNLLVQDDDEDSDTSVDPEEVQKQLEMAAAQAEVELAPLQLLEAKVKQVQPTAEEVKSIQDLNKSGNEEDSKSKFKKLLSKMAEKVAAKQKQNKREKKLQRKKKSKESSSELTNKLRFLEDPDIEDEVEFLKECGLKNQSDTLRLSRLIVRAKLLQTRLNLLEILRKGDLPCRRLFLDYHGLRLLHGWMSEDAGNMQIRLSLLQTLETLPIANKTVLTDSKVMQAVRNWCGANTNLSPNDDSSSSNSNSQEAPVPSSNNFEEGSEMAELHKLALKLITTWDGLPEIFRIPKKERIEQMKEHEREADRQYAANAETQESNTATDRYRRDRFGRGLNAPNSTSNCSNRFVKPNNGNPHKSSNTTPENLKNLSKAQRREMFAAKVARDEAEKRLAEERREFETKCRFFGLDPKKTRPQDIPFCVNPSTGQWFSIDRKPIATPPSYAHVQVPIKPKSTDPNDYQLPSACSNLPSQWKYAITPQGKIYYYHIKNRISQWEPPSSAQLQRCELEDREEDSESEISTTAGEDSSDDDDDVLIGMDSAQLKTYIDRKVESRRQKRYQRLVDQRSISPRREEDRIYNQLEVRKYKENKEKIRKRKEDIRRKRAETLRQTSLNMCTLGSITDTNSNKSIAESDRELGILPIQDYLLSSDEEVDLKAETTSPLMDKIVEGDKIVDELDALTSKRQLKRPLPPQRDFNEPPCSSVTSAIPNPLVAKQEYKKRKLEKKDKRKPKEQDAKYRKNKEKFRCEIAGIIVHHLKPYLKETCSLGRIQSNEDFNHLARKLTHFVMIKELKYCESVGQTLVVTESVKSKSREFIKKYMAKYGDVYIKPNNDPDFKDIPFTL